jgi:NAD(P)-dependent dehydrogenase (short-subunit alcohol dehydrogenase family)
MKAEKELEGKVAFITGAGSGIGKAAALLFAKQGAKIAALGRTEDELRETVEEIKKQGGEGIVLLGDISQAADMERTINETVTKFGHLDVVFANAGINGVWAPIEELSPEEWDKTININLRGYFSDCQICHSSYEKTRRFYCYYFLSEWNKNLQQYWCNSLFLYQSSTGSFYPDGSSGTCKASHPGECHLSWCHRNVD